MATVPTAAATFEALLDRWLPEYGFTPPAPVRARFAHYLQLLQAGNERIRLVGDAEAETLVRRHLGESLYLGRMAAVTSQALLDVGSGAGFPGLALAIAYPDLETTLVEATAKKAAFLESVLAALGLAERVRVANVHVPTAVQPRVPMATLLTCRALDHMAGAPDWIFTLLAPGGTAAFWVSRTLAASWRLRYPRIAWGEPQLLPFADERALVLASVPGVA